MRMMKIMICCTCREWKQSKRTPWKLIARMSINRLKSSYNYPCHICCDVEMLTKQIRPQRYWDQGSKEKVNRMEVLSCQGHCSRVIVMIFVKIWVQVSRVCQAVEYVECKVFADKQKDESQEQLLRVWDVLCLETKRLFPITHI